MWTQVQKEVERSLIFFFNRKLSKWRSLLGILFKWKCHDVFYRVELYFFVVWIIYFVNKVKTDFSLANDRQEANIFSKNSSVCSLRFFIVIDHIFVLCLFCFWVLYWSWHEKNYFQLSGNGVKRWFLLPIWLCRELC